MIRIEYGVPRDIAPLLVGSRRQPTRLTDAIITENYLERVQPLTWTQMMLLLLPNLDTL